MFYDCLFGRKYIKKTVILHEKPPSAPPNIKFLLLLHTKQSQMNHVELLCRLIETPRYSREETDAADIVEAYMKSHGLSVMRQGNNLWSIHPAASGPTVLLNAHIDTVHPVSTWTRNPHKAVIEGDYLYGLGSNDDGASLVSLLETFIQYSRKSLPYTLIMLVSAEEEVSGKNGIESVLPLLPPIDVAIVGEPTGMQPAIAEKGLMVVDVTAHGKAGHAARDEGVNAIDIAVRDIIRIHSLPSHLKASPLLGPVKMTTTIIHAGTQHNVIPGECTFTVDVRSNELYDNETLFNYICSEISSTAKARSFRLSSSSIDEHHPLVQKLLRMGKQPFGSPTLSDQALMHFPSLKMGPGNSSRSHTADEFILLSEIEDAIATYLSILLD